MSAIDLSVVLLTVAVESATDVTANALTIGEQQFEQIWPIAAYFILLMVLLAIMLGLSAVLGPKTNRRHTHTPYESGIIAVDAPKSRFTNHFFLYAIFFVIFDLETIFLFAWVIAFDEVGIAGFIEAAIFIGILLVALIYVWRIGALQLKHKHLPARELLRASAAKADNLSGITADSTSKGEL
ncbi:NADH-quinone oxidoreductase subunit A [Thalassotalea fonticola]|uniref:NADH-quinone oxidoreductase subunit A n=1 Tax=Thalassotalea fonticola TaxID=3065649 RepID=A0ABZ0GTK8_9GAMM|nr:NADH-quinone oxidoreductase subunit A [Colwelliaceae bacterium S1-1]